ncbi:EAL domain-containing protein [Herbaspirillum sp. GCM10030257]|uniref:bifunctional diguanylate cyclase/phosphodiesterase n=1 Tax=Herbaspirillum sp. GCM10030257 TaxID=3273393 RepID=UPI003611384D
MRVLLIAFLTLLFIGIITNLIYTLSQARQGVLQLQQLTSEKLVHVLEQQTADSLNAVELALQSSSRSIALPSSQKRKDDEAVHDILVSAIRNLPFVRAIWVLDTEGDMIHDSERLPGKYNLSDRDYFKVHRETTTQGLYIDRPQLSKHGVWFIGVSLRISRPDGSFGGVIAAAVEPRHFHQFYKSIKPGNDGVVSLLGTDGTLMLRVPDQHGIEGKKLNPLPRFVGMLPHANVGSYSAKSSVDNVERIYFYRRVRGRPLVVLVGIGEREVLAPWRNAAQAYTAVSVAFLFLVCWLGYVGLHELRRRASLHKALVSSESALNAAQKLARIGSWEFDLQRKKGKWSEEMFALLAMQKTPDSPPLHQFLEALHPDDRTEVESAFRQGRAWLGELRTNPDKGPVRYLYFSSAEQKNERGETTAISGTLQDVTQRHFADEKLNLAARVFNHMQDGIVVTDIDGRIVAVNAAFERITGYPEMDVLGQHPTMLRSERHHDAFYRSILDAVETNGEWRGEIWGKRKNGAAYLQWMTISVMRDNAGRRTGYVAVITDLSEITEANAQLTFLSNHDPLTRLPNRRLLNDRLQQTIDNAQPEHPAVAVLILNVDRLQRLNDSLGHEAGDTVLWEIARRLIARLPHGDTLARPGSDKFVIVFTRFEDNNDVITFAHQLLDEIAAPILVQGRNLSVTASVGISVYPYDGIHASDLLKNADAALSNAKQYGPGTLRFFKSTMNAQALHWISIEHELRGALGRNELLLYYQPQVCLSNGRLCGVEALLRWDSPKLGMVMPADFIPMAEDIGLIVQIGEWVIRQACAQARDWQETGPAPLIVAVNVSAQQVAAGTLVQVVESALAQSGLQPRYLEIELTESVLMRDTEIALRQIAALRELGVRVSLDDFGTGYSSLGYLSRFALDKLKIDQCFIRDIIADTRSAAIARATIALAHGLGIRVIAEGVENAEQLEYLRAAGCDEVQGFLIGRPAPPSQLAELQMSWQAISPC